MLALRQSCDRCHEHKVRCIREMPEKTVPCARCIRAGTSCIYSIQQKPGRRMSSKESTSTRKRTARASMTPMDLISDESKSDAQMSSDEWLHDIDALTASLSPSPNETITSITPTTAEEASSYFCLDPFESPLVDRTQAYIEQLAALISSVGRSVSIMFGSASRLSLSTSSPPFTDICASTGSLIMIITQLSQLDPTQDDGGLDVSMQDLDAHINSIPAFDYLPTAAVGRGTTTTTDNNKQPTTMLPAPQLSPVTLMLILACYQRLLEAFEIICLFMQQRLQELEMCSFMGPLSPLPPPLPSPHAGTISPPSETLQFIMMIKLTSDLFNRLDRAMTSLVGDVHGSTAGGAQPLGPPGWTRQRLSPDRSPSSASSTRSSCSSSSSSSSPSSLNPIGYLSSDNLSDRKAAEGGESQMTSEILTLRAGEQLQQQHRKLRALIKVVKKLVRSQKV